MIGFDLPGASGAGGPAKEQAYARLLDALAESMIVLPDSDELRRELAGIVAHSPVLMFPDGGTAS